MPGVVYGDGQPPFNVSIDHAELKQRIYAGRFLTTIYELDVDGTKQRVIPRDFQLDAVKDLPVHVDFLRLGEGAHIRVRPCDACVAPMPGPACLVQKPNGFCTGGPPPAAAGHILCLAITRTVSWLGVAMRRAPGAAARAARG